MPSLVTVEATNKALAAADVPVPAPQTIVSPAQQTTLRQVQNGENVDGPAHQYQVTQQLLYEQEYHGQAYVSAHLQRVQHGFFGDDLVHAKDPLYVTFVAVTFTFHPSLSISHRFESAVIEITARAEGKPLRFVKFAPHAAYGRISSENLKWNFKLGATVGVTQGPANLSVDGSREYEKDKVLGTMMKIQGSTRSQAGRNRCPDTKLVWSMEENDQQMTGLPREFTFVFLLARPVATRASREGAAGGHEMKDAATSYNFFDPDTTFSPFHISITVKPRISGIMPDLTILEHAEESKVEGEVGQMLKAAVGDAGYYNFAQMPGNFEDLVELPGNSVSSVV